MGMGKVYAYTASMVFAVLMAVVMWRPFLSNTALESWAQQYINSYNLSTSDYQYQPPQSITTFLGDFVWGLAKTIQLFGSTPQIIADLLSAAGVPDLWARFITFTVTFSLIAYIIYVVSGRLLTTRD